jgi:hypothetical protein
MFRRKTWSMHVLPRVVGFGRATSPVTWVGVALLMSLRSLAGHPTTELLDVDTSKLSRTIQHRMALDKTEMNWNIMTQTLVGTNISHDGNAREIAR